MGRKKNLITWLICSLFCMLACFPVWAGSNSQAGGTVQKRDGQTDIMAGIVVDYMGKLRFEVLDRDTHNPIPGASVEIFIPSLNRYVLFGMTDSNGIYELDVAYNMNASVPDSDQFIENDGDYTFSGTLVYLNDNNIQYRVYKADWLPYPYEGSHILEGKKIPETVTVYLYQEKKTGPGGGGGSDDKETSPDIADPGSSGGQSFVDKLISILDEILPLGGFGGTGGLPKTGVEGALHYWAFGLLFFLLAGGAVWKLSKIEKENKEKKRRG